MGEGAAWAEQVYDRQSDNWPDRCVNPDQWVEWHQQAARGNYPSIVDVAQEQYQRKTPWYVREGLWGFLPKALDSKETITQIREIPRGAGKTVANTLKELYLMEYVLPYYPGLERENRRVNVISRSARHLADENWFLMHQMIPYYSPWHKFPDGKLWGDPEAAIERQIRRRKFNDRRIDAAIGTRLQAYGWDQNVRGSHPFGTDIDDMLADDNWQHAEEQIRVILGAVVPSVVRGGFVQIVGTPQAPDDAVERLSDSDSWDYAQYPAFDVDGDLGYREKNEADVDNGHLEQKYITCEEDWYCLNPQFLPFNELERRQGSSRDDMNAYLREYMLRRIVANLKLVDPNAVLAGRNTDRHYHRSIPSNHPYPVYAGLDPSRLKGSHIACVVLDVDDEGRRRLLAVETIDPEEVDDELEIIHFVNRINTLFHPQWLVEDNGFQGILRPLSTHLAKGMRMDSLAVTNIKHTDAGWKIIKTYYHAGALDMPFGPEPEEAKQLEAGAWPQGHDFQAQETTKKVERQVNALMRRDGKIVGQKKIKDDIVSALYLALKASEDSGKVAPGTEVVDLQTLLDRQENHGKPKGAEFGRPRNPAPFRKPAKARHVDDSADKRLSRAFGLDTR